MSHQGTHLTHQRPAVSRGRLSAVSCLLSIGLTGCSGMPPAQVGQTAGTIVGAAVAPGIGPPVGALIGLLAGMVVQGEVDKATEKRERKDLSEQMAQPAATSTTTSQLPGTPTRVWVDETLQQGRSVRGHFELR